MNTKRSNSEPPTPYRNFRLDAQGIIANWKSLGVLLTLLLGGGGSWLAWDVANEDEVDNRIVKHATDERSYEDERYQRHDRIIVNNSKAINGLVDTVGEIQSVQHKQVAREEARRVTSEINDRERRELEYDRLADQNMRRLRAGRDPCSTVTCEN